MIDRSVLHFPDRINSTFDFYNDYKDTHDWLRIKNTRDSLVIAKALEEAYKKWNLKQIEKYKASV